MRELPAGTVTFLFTDIEGSTRLLRDLGAEGYARALAEHRRVLRAAFAAHGGVEVDTQGDAFFVAFPTAPGALAAASDAQAALAIPVRMGVHTGTPLLAEEGYVGVDVNRAARIAAAGHGGQVLVSASTRALADGFELRDLGEHRFKDLTAAERMFQLGQDDFPSLKTLYQTNLPVVASSLVGRDAELAAVVELARRTGVRLLTLTGVGGTGKTRLALQAAAELAEEFPGGVWFVGLSALTDPVLVVPTVAQTLEARTELASHIGDRRLLLLLDNLEQVIAAGTELAGLLTVCPNLCLLVTSREPLHVSGEQEFPVPPLVLSEAESLFRERALAVDPGFVPNRTVSDICRRLDGLPLAIELAAARVKLLAPATLLERLGRALPLLTGGARDAPERQQTLRATIEWSHALLTPEEQRLFRRLAVFAGGFELEAAEEVAEADVDALGSLLDKSLVRRHAGTGRFFLFETIREYALERLEASGEADEVESAHADYFARVADGRWGELITGESDWRDVVARDSANFMAALERSLAQLDADGALAVITGIWPSGMNQRVARELLERTLGIAGGASPTRRAYALGFLGNTAQIQGDLEAARRALESSLDLFRGLDDAFGTAMSLTQLADVVLEQGDTVRAHLLAEESFVIRRDRLAGLALPRVHASLAQIAVAEGDLGRARELLDEGLARLRAETPQSVFIPQLLAQLAEVARLSGNDGDAVQFFAEAARVAALRRDEITAANALDGLAAVRAVLGDLETAARLGGAAEREHERLGLSRPYPKRPVPPRIEPAWSEGRALTPQQAVEYALSSVD